MKLLAKWSKFTPEEPGNAIAQLLKNKQLKFDGTLTVIDNKSIRQRKFE